MAIQRAANANTSQESSTLGRSYEIAALSIAIVLVIAVIAWLVHLEGTLPDIRTPRSTTSTDLLPGHRLMAPGYHDIEQVDIQTTGDWIQQAVGDRTWLATEEPGSQLRAVFYGTQLDLIARVGPEAGIAYVTIDGEPVPTLPSDETGSYVSLWTIEATDRAVRLASGLAHGEHLVEIKVGENEVAVAGFDVEAQTPFPWAFALAYAGLAGTLFFAVRQLLYSISARNTTPTDVASEADDGTGTR